jgi:hypothetical protein
MKLEKFKRVFELHKENDKFLDDSSDILGVDMGESVPVTSFWEMIDLFWSIEYTEGGIDWINWFMFERSDDEGPYAWDENKNPILNDLEELWEYVEENYKLK